MGAQSEASGESFSAEEGKNDANTGAAIADCEKNRDIEIIFRPL